MKTDFTKFTDMTDAQRAKLPSYARDYITWLEHRVHEVEVTMFEETTRLGPRQYVNAKLTDPRHEPKCGIIVDPNGPNPLACPNHTVRFWMPLPGSERWIDIRIEKILGGGVGLNVMGATSLEIQPGSSNQMAVKVVR